jgi:hypothetical protein
MRETVKEIIIFLLTLEILKKTDCYGENIRIRFRNKLNWVGDCG